MTSNKKYLLNDNTAATAEQLRKAEQAAKNLKHLDSQFEMINDIFNLNGRNAIDSLDQLVGYISERTGFVVSAAHLSAEALGILDQFNAVKSLYSEPTIDRKNIDKNYNLTFDYIESVKESNRTYITDKEKIKTLDKVLEFAEYYNALPFDQKGSIRLHPTTGEIIVNKTRFA